MLQKLKNSKYWLLAILVSIAATYFVTKNAIPAKVVTETKFVEVIKTVTVESKQSATKKVTTTDLKKGITVTVEDSVENTNTQIDNFIETHADQKEVVTGKSRDLFLGPGVIDGEPYATVGFSSGWFGLQGVSNGKEKYGAFVHYHLIF